MNVKILGWYGHDNIGDESYKVAFPMLFPSHDLEYVESVGSPEPDVVILGGGDVVYPGFTDYIRGLKRARKVLASVTLTENSDFGSLGLFEKVFVRDHRSLAWARKISPGTKVSYLPDFSFMLTPDRKAGRKWLEGRFGRMGHELYEKVVVVVVSNYLSYSHLDSLARDLTTFLKLSQDLAQTADQTNASFVFLPFCTRDPHDDRCTNSWVANRCKYYSKNIVVHDRLTVQETLDIISSADVVVSSRLHSTVFATIAGVPFIDLTHHTKNLGFIETVGKTRWSLPFWEFNIGQYRGLLSEFLDADRPDPTLQAFSHNAREQLKSAEIL